MSSIVARYGLKDMNPNERYRIELDSNTSRGDLWASAKRFAAKHGYGVELYRGETARVMYLKFTKARERMLLDPADRRP